MVGGCKGERSGDELGDGFEAPSLKALQYSAARVSPGSLQEAGNNNMFLLAKIVPDYKYLYRLLKYENNPLIL